MNKSLLTLLAIIFSTVVKAQDLPIDLFEYYKKIEDKKAFFLDQTFIDVEDTKKQNILHYIAMDVKQEYFTLDVLLEAYRLSPKLLFKKNINGFTPIMLAAKNDNIEAFKLMAAMGSNTHDKTSDGRSLKEIIQQSDEKKCYNAYVQFENDLQPVVRLEGQLNIGAPSTFTKNYSAGSVNISFELLQAIDAQKIIPYICEHRRKKNEQFTTMTQQLKDELLAVGQGDSEDDFQISNPSIFAALPINHIGVAYRLSGRDMSPDVYALHFYGHTLDLDEDLSTAPHYLFSLKMEDCKEVLDKEYFSNMYQKHQDVLSVHRVSNMGYYEEIKKVLSVCYEGIKSAKTTVFNHKNEVVTADFFKKFITESEEDYIMFTEYVHPKTHQLYIKLTSEALIQRGSFFLFKKSELNWPSPDLYRLSMYKAIKDGLFLLNDEHEELKEVFSNKGEWKHYLNNFKVSDDKLLHYNYKKLCTYDDYTPELSKKFKKVDRKLVTAILTAVQEGELQAYRINSKGVREKLSLNALRANLASYQLTGVPINQDSSNFDLLQPAFLKTVNAYEFDMEAFAPLKQKENTAPNINCKGMSLWVGASYTPIGLYRPVCYLDYKEVTNFIGKKAKFKVKENGAKYKGNLWEYLIYHCLNMSTEEYDVVLKGVK